MAFKNFKNIKFVPSNTKISKQITTDDISEFTSIHSAISLNDGCLVRNFSSENILVKTDSNSHGNNSGYLLKPSNSIFVEVNDISKIQVLNESGSGTVSVEVIGS